MHYQPKFHVVLYQPEIPYNTGSVGRTCVAVGAKLWLVRPLGFKVDDYHLRRAGMDYWERLEWEAVDHWQQLEERLAGRRFWYFSKKAQQSYASVAYQPDDVLVFGRESQGLPDAVLAANQQHAVRIPIRDDARSLNLSNSVAVAAFEAVRQWDDLNAIQAGIDDIEAGRYKPLAQVDAELREKYNIPRES